MKLRPFFACFALPVILALGLTAKSSAQLSLTVTSTADSGPGTLRDAINQCDATGSATNTISFNITASGPVVIQLQSDLPELFSPTSFQGATEGTNNPGASLEIAGGNLEFGPGSQGSSLTNLAFTGGELLLDSDNDVVQGCRFGIHANGTAATTFGNAGVEVSGNNCQVGGAAANQGNVISNCLYGVFIFGTGAQVYGNLIGTDLTGRSAIGNTKDGVVVNGNNNTVGGEAPGQANLISGNVGDGVLISGSFTGNTVSANLIGTNINGNDSLGNSGWGIELGSDATSNTIGGSTKGSLVICSNVLGGIKVGDNFSGTVENNTIQNCFIGFSAGEQFGNQGPGISLGFGPTSPSSVINPITTTVNNNVIVRNQIGISVTGPNNLIENNTFENNFTAQIQENAGAIGTTITQNPMFENQTSNPILINSGIETPVAPTLQTAVSDGNITTINGFYGGGSTANNTYVNNNFTFEAFSVFNHNGTAGGLFLNAVTQTPGIFTVQDNRPKIGDSIFATVTAVDSSFQNSSAISGATSPASSVITVVPDVANVTTTQSQLAGGASTTGTVSLVAAAPVPVTVTLISNGTFALQVPNTVTVQANKSSANFPVTTSGVNSSVTITITALENGSVNQSTTQVTVFPIPGISSLSLYSPAGPFGGQRIEMKAVLAFNAPPGGTVLKLSASAGGSALQLPATVTVPQFQRFLFFYVQTNPVAANTMVTMAIAEVSGPKTTTTFTLAGPVLTKLILPTPAVIGGNNISGFAYLSGPAGGSGRTVNLASSKTSVATLPPTLAIGSGKSSASFVIKTLGVAATSTSVISATLAPFKVTATVIVKPAALTALTANASSIAGGANVYITVQLNGAAPPNGATVILRSNNKALTPPTSAVIGAGLHSTVIRVTAGHVTGTVPVTVTGTYLGVSHSVVVSVSG